MAVVRNITPDVKALFRADAPPVQPGDEVTVSDENFVGRAWPKSTWELVEPPTGFTDIGNDAYIFVLPEQEAAPGDPLPELPEGAYPPEATPLDPPTRGRAKKES